MPLLKVSPPRVEPAQVVVEVVNCSGADTGEVEQPCSIIFSLRASHPHLFICRGTASSGPRGLSVMEESAAIWEEHGCSLPSTRPESYLSSSEDVASPGMLMMNSSAVAAGGGNGGGGEGDTPHGFQTESSTGSKGGSLMDCANHASPRERPTLVREVIPDYVLLPGERREIVLDVCDHEYARRLFLAASSGRQHSPGSEETITAWGRPPMFSDSDTVAQRISAQGRGEVGFAPLPMSTRGTAKSVNEKGPSDSDTSIGYTRQHTHAFRYPSSTSTIPDTAADTRRGGGHSSAGIRTLHPVTHSTTEDEDEATVRTRMSIMRETDSPTQHARTGWQGIGDSSGSSAGNYAAAHRSGRGTYPSTNLSSSFTESYGPRDPLQGTVMNPYASIGDGPQGYSSSGSGGGGAAVAGSRSTIVVRVPSFEQQQQQQQQPYRCDQRPVFLYVYYERLGDESKCVDVARKWLVRERKHFRAWQTTFINAVVTLEKKRQKAIAAAAAVEHVGTEGTDGVSDRSTWDGSRSEKQPHGGRSGKESASHTATGGGARRHSLVHNTNCSGSSSSCRRSTCMRIIPPVLDNPVRWQRVYGTSGSGSGSGGHGTAAAADWSHGSAPSHYSLAAFSFFYSGFVGGTGAPTGRRGSTSIPSSSSLFSVLPLTTSSSINWASILGAPLTYTATRTNGVSKSAAKIFSKARVGSGTIVLPLREHQEPISQQQQQFLSVPVARPIEEAQTTSRGGSFEKSAISVPNNNKSNPQTQAVPRARAIVTPLTPQHIRQDSAAVGRVSGGGGGEAGALPIIMSGKESTSSTIVPVKNSSITFGKAVLSLDSLPSSMSAGSASAAKRNSASRIVDASGTTDVLGVEGVRSGRGLALLDDDNNSDDCPVTRSAQVLGGAMSPYTAARTKTLDPDTAARMAPRTHSADTAHSTNVADDGSVRSPRFDYGADNKKQSKDWASSREEQPSVLEPNAVHEYDQGGDGVINTSFSTMSRCLASLIRSERVGGTVSTTESAGKTDDDAVKDRKWTSITAQPPQYIQAPLQFQDGGVNGLRRARSFRPRNTNSATTHKHGITAILVAILHALQAVLIEVVRQLNHVAPLVADLLVNQSPAIFQKMWSFITDVIMTKSNVAAIQVIMLPAIIVMTTVVLLWLLLTGSDGGMGRNDAIDGFL